ncbi:TetR/AcrR family transcriptional regulator [Streptomyces sp. NBC_00083]|uniref:TetR/AcrR family transcriptional regulator n=1 Tax=Streptomyces sp. NBC_00083 TaxID=2975647 RepID=UPI00225BA936|nr:TetR/AcrR family transcriptional regulator [Streptomyces sp. NBC_00083]MCX5387095.1 TetR/AcrR family transcriptional regulator [Streptomyces sp. NBC_00083]
MNPLGAAPGRPVGAHVPRSPRERYREQVREEIKRYAWEQIATAGAGALSLNAIAKRMGLSGPALYRYFAGRDELIAELVDDAYRGLADALSAPSGPGADLAALARTLRGWALDDPHRYLLVCGTPVPGRPSPAATAIADIVMAPLLEACEAEPSRTPLTAQAARRRALTVWTRLHGVLSLEVAGHFAGMGFDPARVYEAELRQLLAESADLPAP